MGCESEPTPSEVYEEYNLKVSNGMTFDEEKAYYTERKKNEVESKIPQYMKKMNKSREEVIKFYTDFSQSVAKCKEITLIKESIDGVKAVLIYDQKDICGNDSGANEKQTVHMINDGKWKIDDVEISL
jgi:hypothetical protein